jgi:hypothetical protein
MNYDQAEQADFLMAGSSPHRGGISPERRRWVHQETIKLQERNRLEREGIKKQIQDEENERQARIREFTEARAQKWMVKARVSPYDTDLIAQDERLAEESRIREHDLRMSTVVLDSKRERAKNDIILKALSEFSDLEALRREKRAILEEEQRLRALLALEKSKKQGKESRLAAERAMKQRSTAKLDHRRTVYKDSLNKIVEEESMALRRKHGL